MNKNQKRIETLRKEIGQLMVECQAFQAQENDYMIEKLEKKIDEKRKELKFLESQKDQI
jgi:hypothetical protein